MGKFVLGAIVGAIMIAGIVATCSDRLTVGKAEALTLCDGLQCEPVRPLECTVFKTCTYWAYGWHPQHQRMNGKVQTVQVLEWFCVGWTPSEAEQESRFSIQTCKTEVLRRESGQ